MPSDALNPRKTPLTQVGRFWEDRTAIWAVRCGYRVLARQFRFRRGEIDLILEKQRLLVFVEVRFRSRSIDDALSSVSSRKQQRIRAAAAVYLSRYGGNAQEVRFDVVAWTKNEPLWVRDAFR